MEKQKITMDLKGMSLGRAASLAASALRGKNSPNFMPNKTLDVVVELKNVDKLNISEKKLNQKQYKSYSGYPSGLKKTDLGELYKKDPEKVFTLAVRGMLAKTKLRKGFLKNIHYVD